MEEKRIQELTFEQLQKEEASRRLVRMLKAKQETEGLKTYDELAKAIQPFCTEKITEHNIGSYFRGIDNGKYTFPSGQKLAAIGIFLGYDFESFRQFLFDEQEQQKPNKDLTNYLLQQIANLSQYEKISLHRFLSEDLYRELLF